MQDRSPEAKKSLADRLGIIGATFYHLESANFGVESVSDIKKALQGIDPNKTQVLAIDLGKVTYINERGVNVLLGLRNRFRKVGSEVVLLDPGKQCVEKLDQIGVLEDFRHFDSKK